MSNLPPTEGSQPEATVLLVEDEFLLRLMMSDLLQENGFKVLEATTADEAVMAIQAEVTIDLVFTDVRLPGRMTGLDLAAFAKQSYPELPVVVTSGFIGKTELPEGTCFLPKPYLPDGAMALIRKQVL